MALFDVMFEFCDDQTVWGDEASDHTLDMQASDLEMGAGRPIYLNIRCGTTFDSAGDTATMVISLVNDDDNTIDVDSIKILSTRALTVGDPELTAGGSISFSLPVDFDFNRYIGLWFENAVQAFTAGTLDAWLGYESIGSHDTQVSVSNI